MFGKRIRHLKRYQDVAKVLTRHGFGFFVKETGLYQLLSLPKRLFLPKQEDDPAPPPKKPTHSRLLRVYEERNKEREKQRNGALDFRKPKGGGYA